MKKHRIDRWLSGFLVIVMALTMIVFDDTRTFANQKIDQIQKLSKDVSEGQEEAFTEDEFQVPSGSKIEGSELLKGSAISVKGRAKAGERTYTVTLEVKDSIILGGMPLINYDQKEVKDKTKFTLQKDGRTIHFYQEYSAVTPFDELNSRTEAVLLPNHVDANVPYYTMEQILDAGIYTFTYEMPETVTDGARIYLQLEGMPVLYGKEQSSNTKQTARVIKVPTEKEEDYEFYSGAAYMAGEEKEYWYQFSLPAARLVDLTMDCIVFNTNKTSQLTLYYPNGTQKTYRGMAETIKDQDDISDLISISNLEFSQKLQKGTYYIKITPGDLNGDGFFNLSADIPGPSTPRVTYWAKGKKILRGTGEPGSKAYAKINGKTYYAKYQTNAKGEFSIKIPSVKAGTKIAVRVKDSLGVSSQAKTVVVRNIPKRPTLTSYRSGSKKVSGRCVYNGTVTVRYNGKTYRKKSSSKGIFTVNTAALRSGRELRIFVTDISGNVSAVRVYKIR